MKIMDMWTFKKMYFLKKAQLIEPIVEDNYFICTCA